MVNTCDRQKMLEIAFVGRIVEKIRNTTQFRTLCIETPNTYLPFFYFSRQIEKKTRDF